MRRLRAERTDRVARAQREIAEVSRVAREALAQVRSAVTGIRAAGIAAALHDPRRGALAFTGDGGLLMALAGPSVQAGVAPARRGAAGGVGRSRHTASTRLAGSGTSVAPEASSNRASHASPCSQGS